MKHMRFAYCPFDGYVYGHGGDFAVIGDNEGIGTNSGRAETWRFDPRGSLARWERVVGYWGKRGDPQPYGSDERQIFWDGVINKFWLWPSARFVGSVQNDDRRWVGIPEPRSNAPMLLLNPANGRFESAPWTENRSALPAGGTFINKKCTLFDEVAREFHGLAVQGSGANTVTILDVTTGVWSAQNLKWTSTQFGFGSNIQTEPCAWDPANRVGWVYDAVRSTLTKYTPATRTAERIMSAADLAPIPTSVIQNEHVMLWNNDTGLLELYRAKEGTIYPHRLWIIDPENRTVVDGGDTWPDGTRRTAHEWVYVPGVGSIGCGQAFAAGSGVNNTVVGIGSLNEHWMRWIKQRDVASHARVVPQGSSSQATDESSPVTSTGVPFRAWGSPILDEASGDIYLFGSMHGDYMANDIDVVNLARASNRRLPHTPPPERGRLPHTGDPAFGSGGSAQAWYEGTGYASHPQQGAPVSHWWMPYAVHAWERNSYHPSLGYLVFASGVKQWNDPSPPTQAMGLLAYSKTGTTIGGGRTQRWTYLGDQPSPYGAGASVGWTMANFAPDLGVVVAFATPSSEDSTAVYEIRANGSMAEIRKLPAGSTVSNRTGGSLHRYMGNGKFLNVAWSSTGPVTSVYDHLSGTVTSRLTTGHPPQWAALIAGQNLLAAVDRVTQTIYWAQLNGANTIKVWSAPVSSPYTLTEIAPRPPGVMTTLGLPTDALSTQAAGRGQLLFFGDSLWLITKGGTSAPNNNDGGYQFWRMVVRV